MREIVKKATTDRVTERYSQEQGLDPSWKKEVAKRAWELEKYPFIENKIELVTDKQLQFAGNDAILDFNGRHYSLDFKFDFYDNNNVVIETYNAHHIGHEKGWLALDPEQTICYVKVAGCIAYVFKVGDLQKFADTATFNYRKEVNVNGNGTIFKNFRISEFIENNIPFYSIRIPWCKSGENFIKPDKLGESLYKNYDIWDRPGGIFDRMRNDSCS